MKYYLAAIAAVLLCVASPAFASSSVSCSEGYYDGPPLQTITDQSTCSLTSQDGIGGSTANADYADQSISTTAYWFSASGPRYPGFELSGTATLTYYFQVLGPADGNPVPIVISTNLHAGPYGVPGLGATARISVADVFKGVTNEASYPGYQDFSGNLSTIVNSGDVQEVTLFANTNMNEYADFGGGSATADASIFIDPTFADAAKYTIQFSRIAPLAGVPEPATWAMFLLGFGTIGFALRRSRRLPLVA